MQHTSKTDPRRAPRPSRPGSHAPQRTARITKSGAVVPDTTPEKSAPFVSEPARKPRSTHKATAHKAVTRQASTRAAAKRTKLRRAQIALLGLSGLVCLVLLAMISMVHADYRWMKKQADTKAELLAVLHEQQQTGKRRLAALASGEGHEQLLLEHGYIRPGDRILLFPATREEQRKREIPKNDLAPHPPSMTEDSSSPATGSAWRRAGAVIGGWWQNLQAAAGIKPSTAPRTAPN